jgi:glutamate carboxypeptidase
MQQLARGARPIDGALMQQLRRELQGSEKAMLELLGRFVRCESPSHDKAAVDRMGRMVAGEWRRRGAKVQLLRQNGAGNHVRVEVWLNEGHARGEASPGAGHLGREVSRGQGHARGQILVLGHLDTVYPEGTLARMPFRVAGGRALGPGVFDMKGGLMLALFAVDALRALKIRAHKRFVFFWNSDEEIGSATSRAEIEREAKRSDAVLVLEPAAGVAGKLKTARKGVGTAEVIVRGRSAHAGIDPSTGVNAVHELALQIARLMKMNEARRGITVQTTVISGGTASNVVPDDARAKVDIRYAHLADAPRIDRNLRALRPILKGAQLEVLGGVNRPPLERTRGVEKLFHHAKSLMREIGLDLDEASTGGGSDGNFTGALGIPTLDGLGAIGGAAHSSEEFVEIRALPERAALLAGLLATL